MLNARELANKLRKARELHWSETSEYEDEDGTYPVYQFHKEIADQVDEMLLEVIKELDGEKDV